MHRNVCLLQCQIFYTGYIRTCVLHARVHVFMYIIQHLLMQYRIWYTVYGDIRIAPARVRAYVSLFAFFLFIYSTQHVLLKFIICNPTCMGVCVFCLCLFLFVFCVCLCFVFVFVLANLHMCVHICFLSTLLSMFNYNATF